jgi:uracil-DNA glycosylase
MLNKNLQRIFDKYKKKGWLAGNFIPPKEKEKYRIMFIGKKPSDFFDKYGDQKCLNKSLKNFGNYNATFTDIGFQCFLKKHNLGKVYVTDMVKTEGKARVDFKEFKEQWDSNDDFKECLKKEIDCYKPQLIVLMGGDVEKLFRKNLKELNVEPSKLFFPVYHPWYLGRSPHATVKWDEQFEGILKQLK